MAAATVPPIASECVPEPWLTDFWLETWWAHFARGRQRLEIPLPPWGAPLPLLRERRYGVRRLCGLGGHSQRRALRCAASELPQLAPALAAALARRRDWDWLELDRLVLPHAQALAAALRAAGLRAECAAPLRQRYIPLDRPWPQIAALWRPSLVAELERKQRALRRRGSLECHWVAALEPAAIHFEACLRLEAAGWKGRMGTAMLSAPDTAAFYRALVCRLARAGMLRLACLTLDGRLLAFRLCSLRAGVLAGLKTGYDETPAWRKFSPGQLLLLLMLRQAHAHGWREYDLLGGDEAAKAAWTPYFRELTRLRAFNRTRRGRAAACILRWRARSRHHGACVPLESSAPASC